MRHRFLTVALLIGAAAAAGCSDDKAQQAIKAINDADADSMAQIMLTVGDPAEAVNYFQRESAAHPDKIELQRGLAKSLTRANQATVAVAAWRKVIAMPGATDADRVSLADAQIRASDWKGAEATLDTVPPTFESFDRYKLAAMVADSKRQWKKADSFYETAVGLTTQPSGVLNNWGFSKLTRGDAAGAEKLFGEALTYDPTNFTVKNNLVLARSAQRKYDMPVIDMTQQERARLLYTAALAAIKQGDVSIGKGLLQDAIDTSPTYFEEAARALAALDRSPRRG